MASKIYDVHGRYLRDAKDGEVLADGEMIRSSIALMDAADPTIARTRMILDSANAPPLMHRPGFAPTTDAERDERERRLQARDAALSDAWRNPPPLESAKPAAPTRTNDAASDARAAYLHRIENAWRHPA